MPSRTGKAILALIAIAPSATMYLADGDFSSCVHAPLIGGTGIAVSLCDALFIQILSQTRELPYMFGKTPAEVDLYVGELNRFHKRTFWAWVVSKCSSAAAIIIPAVLLAAKSGERVYGCRTELYIAGYLAMGVSLASAVYLLQTYFTARTVMVSSDLLASTGGTSLTG